jgi:putative acetyltransferase
VIQPRPEPFDSPVVAALVRAQQEELQSRYDGVGDIGPTREAAMFEPPDGVFLVVRDGERALACGGVCRFDATRGELKRMYVLPDARGRGLGRIVLEWLEQEARRLGYAGLVLETGERQPEAIGLYESAGYREIPCYGVYAEQTTSRCFEKSLATP